MPIQKITQLRNTEKLLKHEQLVMGIIDAIEKGELKKGDRLPSLNKMVNELGYAKKTIVTSYEELKNRGLVESKLGKGYYIVSTETKIKLKVALFLFSFRPFQETFYHTFRQELGDQFQIDVFFHHNTESVFVSIFKSIEKKYGYYVVVPLNTPTVKDILRKISPKKLLIVDRYLDLGDEYVSISQDFESSVYDRLTKLLVDIKKYDEFILVLKDNGHHPDEIVAVYNRFIADHDISGRIERNYEPGIIQKGSAYFFAVDTFLWEFVLECKQRNYRLGLDVGLLSMNDYVVKQATSVGITTISIDFKDLARRAANHVKHRNASSFTMPMSVAKRQSL